MNKPWVWGLGGLILGMIVAPKLRALPILSKLPTVGR